VQYALLIYGDESRWEEGSEDQRTALYAEYDQFAGEAVERGMMRGGEELHSTASATTVRVRDGETLVTDGPFAETKEQLGGFFLLECKDMDEAIEMAAKIPGARMGSIEVRPVVAAPDRPDHDR
jgi:hypothetical protein